MLTPEQLKQRQRTIGASEVAAVAGLSRWKSAPDVWALKARGPNGEVEPLIEPDQTLDLANPGTLGHLLEPAIVELYVMHTARAVREVGTRVHPKFPWASATPDRLVFEPVGHTEDGAPVVTSECMPDRGLEVKLVGPYMVHEWSDGVPEEVVCQCQWNMFVTGLPVWDVAALLGGTGFRVFTVDRDDEAIDALRQLAEAFWTDNVLADVMPDTDDGKAIQRVLAVQHSHDDGTTVEADDEADEVAAELADVKAQIKALKATESQLTGKLCQKVGGARKLKGDWGSFSWATREGSVQWKAVAEALADRVDADAWDQLLKENRADNYRKPGFYPKRAKKGTDK